MNFKEHYIIAEETVNSDTFDYLITIKLYEPAFDKLKAKPGYSSMIRTEKHKLFFAATTTLNKYPFNGENGAISDGRITVGSDSGEFEREDLPYIEIYIKGVKITPNVVQEIYSFLHKLRPHLVSTVVYENLFKGKLTSNTFETFEDIIDEL
jgi:hypothetical protein